MIYTDGTHLAADTLAELHMFAVLIGLRRDWFQNHLRHPHYDLTTKRAAKRAMKRGAKLVSSRRVIQASHKSLWKYMLTGSTR